MKLVLGVVLSTFFVSLSMAESYVAVQNQGRSGTHSKVSIIHAQHMDVHTL